MIAALSEYLLPIVISNCVVASCLAILAVAAARFRFSPSVTHCLWVLVLLKLVTPPVFEVSVPVPAFAPATAPASLRAPNLPSVATPDSVEPTTHPTLDLVEDPATLPLAVTSGADETTTNRTFDWSGIGLGIWIVGALLALGLALYRASRFQSQLRHARPASRDIRAEVRRLSRRLGLRRSPAVHVIPGKLSPMLWGFFGRARVLLPEILERTLTPDQKRTLLAHELAHFHRRDHWVRILEMFVAAVYWWNPLVWWACRELRNAEEECCDAWVVWALPDASRSYADALLDTVEFLSDAPVNLPAPASGIGRVTNLKRRLKMIMQGDNRRSLSRFGRVAVFGLASLTLPLVPAFGQRADEAHDLLRAVEHEKQDADKGRAGQDEVLGALKRAVHVLTKNGHEKDAKVLMELMKKVRSAPAHDAHRPNSDRNPFENKFHELEKDMRKNAEKLHEVERKGDHERARVIRNQIEKLRRHATELHRQHARVQQRTQVDRDQRDAGRARSEARAEENVVRVRRETARRDREIIDRRDRLNVRNGGDNRMRELENRVENLTQAVHRLLHAQEKQNRGQDRTQRRDRKREEVEVEEIEKEEEVEEEVEEVKDIEAEKAGAKRAKKRDEQKRKNKNRRDRDASRRLSRGR